MRLTENATQSPDSDFCLIRYDRGVDERPRPPNELDMASLLSGLNEARGFKATLDLTVRLGLKPRQPQPRWSEVEVDGLRAVAQSGVPELPSDWPTLPFRFHLGLRRPVRGIARRTSRLLAKRSPQRDASWLYSVTDTGPRQVGSHKAFLGQCLRSRKSARRVCTVRAGTGSVPNRRPARACEK